MVSYLFHLQWSSLSISVLILVVVDNGLVQTGFLQSMPSVEVLILVVVDNGLVPTMANVTINGLDGVLILVVVDNGLVLTSKDEVGYESYES